MRTDGSSLVAGEGGEAVYALPSSSFLFVFSATVALFTAHVAGLYGYILSGQSFATPTCLALLLFGLPHGSLDLELVRGSRLRHHISLPILLTMYLSLAAASYAVWVAAPLLALVLFLAIAVIHFAEDWQGCSAPMLSYAIALATLSAPALFHREAIADLFVMLTSIHDASRLAELLALAAPVALITALVGCADMFQNGRRGGAVSAFICLLAMVSLPPLIGFAIYFCLLHSPTHLSASWRQVRSHLSVPLHHMAAAGVVAILTLGALGIAALIYIYPQHTAPSARLFRATFITFSILTVPHMLMPRLVAAWSAQLEKSASRQRQRIFV